VAEHHRRLLATHDAHAVLVEVAPKLRQIGAARAQDPLPILVVRERVHEMLEREVRMSPRGGLTVGDGENDFQGLTEHCEP